MRGVTASKVSVTVAARFTCRVASAIRRIFSTSPPDSLMPIMLGWFASSTTTSAGNVVARKSRDVINQHRQRRPIGYSTIEGQQVRRLHLLFVKVRRAHQGGIVAECGRVFGKAQGFDWLTRCPCRRSALCSEPLLPAPLLRTSRRSSSESMMASPVEPRTTSPAAGVRE